MEENKVNDIKEYGRIGIEPLGDDELDAVAGGGIENLMSPSAREYWNTLSDAEKEAWEKNYNEMNEYLNTVFGYQPPKIP